MADNSLLAAVAERYAATIVDAIDREYPNGPAHVTARPGDRPTPPPAPPRSAGASESWVG